MIRARLVPAAITAATLAAAWLLWDALPRPIALLGLQRYDLLVRLLLVFAALGLAEAVAARLGPRLFPGRPDPTKDPRHDQ